MTNWLRGIDVSNWQGASFNWEAAHLEGVQYAFIKASEGITYADPDFPRNWSTSRARGLARGAYHYLHPDQNIEQQAAFFLTILHDNGLAPGDLVAVDYEILGGLTSGAAAAAAARFIDLINSATRASTVVYTNRAMCWNGACEGLANSPLWLADPGQTDPAPVSPWKLLSFVQTGQRGSVDQDTGYFDSVDQMRLLGVRTAPSSAGKLPIEAQAEAAVSTGAEAIVSPSERPGFQTAAEAGIPFPAAASAQIPPMMAAQAATAAVQAPTAAVHIGLAEQLLAGARNVADKESLEYITQIAEGVLHALIGIGRALPL